MKTGIPELDEMIGVQITGTEVKDIESGTIMLIRGEPGSGKTTLGLQILSNSAKELFKKRKSHQEPTKNNFIKRLVSLVRKIFPPKISTSMKAKLMFISLEQEPEHIIQRVKDSFLFFQDMNKEDILLFGQQDADKLLQDNFTFQKQYSWQEEDSIIKKTTKYTLSVIFGALKGISSSARFEGLYISIIAKFILEMGKYRENTLAIQRVFKRREEYKNIRIILFDSLDVFIENVRKYNETISERLIVNAICQSLRKLCPDAVVIFIGEYHYLDVSKETTISESFLCDIVVSLFVEPIVVPQTWNAQFASPLGNNYLSLLTNESTSLHTQSFCRVMKSRNLQNQSRRCSYDIIPGKGLEFFPSYPGDGHILMFAENEPQERIWNDFCKKDIKVSYPALRYEEFGRMSMQRTSNIWRRVRYCMPTRTDMVLASFDNYWVNWYEEIYLKWTIIDALWSEEIKRLFKKKVDRFYRLINAIGAAVITMKIEEGNLSKLANAEGLRCIRCFWIQEIITRALNGQRNLNKKAHMVNGFLKVFQSFNVRENRVQKNRSGCVNERLWDARDEIQSDASGNTLKKIYSTRTSRTTGCRWKELVGTANVVSVYKEIKIIKTIFRHEKIQEASREIEKIGSGAIEWVKNDMPIGLMEIAMQLTQPVEHRHSIMLPIRQEDLRLFGERRSELLQVFERIDKDELRPIFRPRFFGNLKSKEHLVSLPYNANVGFYVYKQEHYAKYLDCLHQPDCSTENGIPLRQIIGELFMIIRNPRLDDDGLSAKETKMLDQYLDEQMNADEAVGWFTTWEEIIAYAYKYNLQLILETQTLDTYLSSLLEIFWSCGGELSNKSDYQLSDEPNRVTEKFHQAFTILTLLFGLKIVRADSSCDVERIVEHYDRRGDETSENWFLMRHWYSTFIDLITASDKNNTQYKWKPRSIQKEEETIELMPVPTILPAIMENGWKDHPRLHHSCLGDWHWAIMKGSENTKLGVDLLNNLMSSERICERAFANADIPTVELFYDLYGETRCVNPSLRSDIQMPRTTYNKIKDEYLEHAKYRSQIYDYHHCMREFHSVLEYVRGMDFEQEINIQTLKNEVNKKLPKVLDMVDDAIKRIIEDAPGESFLSE